MIITIHFEYEKPKVLQALRYHFISRPEIRIMLILVNVFTLASIILYLFKKVTAPAFLLGSFLWMVLMISFWFILPALVYRRASTFQHKFSMQFEEKGFTLKHEKGCREWSWNALTHYVESPHFFHLYFDSRSFFLVPKRACKDSDEVHQLRTLIKSKVKRG